jgi:hypothetical protein
VPDPVIKGGSQTIYKTLHYNGSAPLEQVTAKLSQYWKIFNGSKVEKWFRFLSIDTNMCKEHPGACPLEPGKPTSLITSHPPLAFGTPYGFYRSKQVYRDTKTGVKLGCVDMRFAYCKTATSCPSAADVAALQERETAARAALITTAESGAFIGN